MWPVHSRMRVITYIIWSGLNVLPSRLVLELLVRYPLEDFALMVTNH